MLRALRGFSQHALIERVGTTVGPSLSHALGGSCRSFSQSSAVSSPRRQEDPNREQGQQKQEQQPGEPEQQQQQEQQQEPPGPSNPDLARYLESLKQLKGSSRVHTETLGVPELPKWQGMLLGFLQGWLDRWVINLVRSRVEQEFDLKEFLEGAKDAFYIVNHLLSNDDFETLKNGMLSAQLEGALETTRSEYRQHGFTWSTELQEDISAGIRGVAFWDKEDMQRYDPKRAEEAPQDIPALERPSGMWLVLTVQLKSKQQVKISRLEDGTLLADLTDWRPQLWRFANGPLPSGLPVRRLESDWFLVSI